MSILFVLLTFLLVITITYFMRRPEPRPAAQPRPDLWARTVAPKMNPELGFEIPKGYCFHPGHTWVLDEGRQNARVGIDAFTGKVLGKIDGIEVAGLNRWVRQGQKIVTIKRGDLQDLQRMPQLGRENE